MKGLIKDFIHFYRDLIKDFIHFYRVDPIAKKFFRNIILGLGIPFIIVGIIILILE